LPWLLIIAVAGMERRAVRKMLKRVAQVSGVRFQVSGVRCQAPDSNLKPEIWNLKPGTWNLEPET